MYSKMIAAAVLLLAVQASAQQAFETADVAAQPTGACADKPYLPGYYALESSDCKQYLHCDQFGNETVFNCGEGTVFNQEFNTCNYPENVTCSDSSKFWDSNKGIGEETGVETPELPKTSFSCSGKPYVPGIYADTEAKCSLFHYCFDDQDAPFACPEGTLFNQKTLTCDWPDNVNCEESANHYDSNKGMGEATEQDSAASETSAKGQAAQQVSQEAQAPAQEDEQEPAQEPAQEAAQVKGRAPAPAQVKAPAKAVQAPVAQAPTKTSAPVSAVKRPSPTPVAAPAPVKAPVKAQPAQAPAAPAAPAQATKGSARFPTVEAQVPVYKTKPVAAFRRSAFARKAAGTKA